MRNFKTVLLCTALLFVEISVLYYNHASIVYSSEIDLSIKKDADSSRIYREIIGKSEQLRHDSILSDLKDKLHQEESRDKDDYIASHSIDDVSYPSSLLLVNKTTSLSSDFIPENLVVPDVPFAFSGYHSKKQLSKIAADSLEKLFSSATDNGIKIKALSGYRSYSRQKSIFASSVKKNGFEQASKFSAKPGHSEHQSGLSMDITSSSVGNILTQRFANTTEGKWLKKNAHLFGFIIRYPKGKSQITGYSYEPWHIRYVGAVAADEIFHSDITLEEYLDKHRNLF